MIIAINGFRPIEKRKQGKEIDYYFSNFKNFKEEI